MQAPIPYQQGLAANDTMGDTNLQNIICPIKTTLSQPAWNTAVILWNDAEPQRAYSRFTWQFGGDGDELASAVGMPVQEPPIGVTGTRALSVSNEPHSLLYNTE